jgi:hypothetical protein
VGGKWAVKSIPNLSSYFTQTIEDDIAIPDLIFDNLFKVTGFNNRGFPMNIKKTLGILAPKIRMLKAQRIRQLEMNAAQKRGMIQSQELNQEIYQAIINSSPFLAGKIGANELLVTIWYLKWRQWSRLWTRLSYKKLDPLEKGAGIFPRSPESYERFASAYIQALAEMDYFGVWHNEGEMKLVSQFAPQAKIGKVLGLEPYLSAHTPWTLALAGKKVLVVTPFAKTMTQQFGNLDKIWVNYETQKQHLLIPRDTQFQVIRFPYGFDPAVQQKYGGWENLLEEMMTQISNQTFDLAILGCGGFSLLVGARIKKMGASAIHLGGATQILFGIQGERWKNQPWFMEQFNEYWTPPLPEDSPEDDVKQRCENACYW